jgi:hypothetical protein
MLPYVNPKVGPTSRVARASRPWSSWHGRLARGPRGTGVSPMVLVARASRPWSSWHGRLAHGPRGTGVSPVVLVALKYGARSNLFHELSPAGRLDGPTAVAASAVPNARWSGSKHILIVGIYWCSEDGTRERESRLPGCFGLFRRVCLSPVTVALQAGSLRYSLSCSPAS